MPIIHHSVLKEQREVSEQAAEIFTTQPAVPWKRGPLPKSKQPTAATVPEEGTPQPPSEED